MDKCEPRPRPNGHERGATAPPVRRYLRESNVIRAVTSLAGVPLLAALVCACGAEGNHRTAAPRERRLVGVSLLTQTHAFYKDLEASMQAEASASGLDLSIVP